MELKRANSADRMETWEDSLTAEDIMERLLSVKRTEEYRYKPEPLVVICHPSEYEAAKHDRYHWVNVQLSYMGKDTVYEQYNPKYTNALDWFEKNRDKFKRKDDGA